MERTLTCAELKATLAGPASVRVLDVRRRPAFQADPWVVPGAIWRDPEEVTSWAPDLDPDRPVVVYCVHGHEVSHGVADRLRALGFAAALLQGGITAWRAAGGPVVPARESEGIS